MGLLAFAEGWQSYHYVEAWQSDLTLWTWAAIHGSTKPRVWVDLGGALAGAGRFHDSRICFQRALEAADLSYVTPWDRQTAREFAAANLASLALHGVTN